jgi:Flp pilus assembly protein TadB
MEILYLTTFGRAFVPKKLRPHLRYFLEKTGREDVPYHVFGLWFILALVITYVIYISKIYPALIGESPLVSLFVSFISFAGLVFLVLFIFAAVAYFWMTMIIYSRTKEMESKLADYFQLVSTSLKGGYSFEKALWAAIKPEFGILAKEIALVSKRVMTGNDVTDALNEFALKYDSPILRRSFDLIIGEVESGGRIVDVLDRVVVDLRKTKALKQEMEASTLTYIIFISSLVIVVLPVLFALSILLYSVISGFMGTIANSLGSSAVAGIPKISKPSIRVSDYKIFSVLAIGIISTFSALIVGIIEKGDIRGGVKYVPVFLPTSLALYFVFGWLLTWLFGQFIG